MFEVSIEKYDKKKLNKLINYLASISDEICFSSLHDYHLDEDECVELIDEYKKRCKEKHKNVRELYENKNKSFMQLISKMGVKDDTSFENYQEMLYQQDLSLCKKMEENIYQLIDNKNVKDYKQIFRAYSDSFKEIETHMFDTITTSIMPLDIVVYKMNEKMKSLLLEIEDVKKPVLENVGCVFNNPLFCYQDNAVAIFNSQDNNILLELTDNQYKEFKKLRIKHEKEYEEDD